MKKKLLLIVSLMLAPSLCIGSTIAYLTASDRDVNVMTLGNIEIEQLELQRKEGVDYRNGGEYGSIYMWNCATVSIYGAEVG